LSGPSHTIWTRYGFAWVTLALFLITLTGHWIFGWLAYAREQEAHGQAIAVAGYTIQMMRATLENWQSEFLQLLWQVAGLAILLHVGSPQSNEGDDRIEAKIDAILLAVEPKRATVCWTRSIVNTKADTQTPVLSVCSNRKRAHGGARQGQDLTELPSRKERYRVYLFVRSSALNRVPVMPEPMPMMDAEATTIPIDDMTGEGDMASAPTNRL
jgi:hypothetical protein